MFNIGFQVSEACKELRSSLTNNKDVYREDKSWEWRMAFSVNHRKNPWHMTFLRRHIYQSKLKYE